MVFAHFSQFFAADVDTHTHMHTAHSININGDTCATNNHNTATPPPNRHTIDSRLKK